jgi:hypothetical protein
MYDELFLIFTAALGSAYIYCLLQVHFLAVKLDRYIGLPRSKFGEIRITDLRLVKTSATDERCAQDAQTAIFNLGISNTIAGSYFVGLALFFLITLI